MTDAIPGAGETRGAGATPGAATTPPAAATEEAGGARRLAARAVVAVATAIVLVGITIALFFNPAWVSFGQARANAAAYTGWTPEQVDVVTRDIVMEVWLGPGTFEQTVDGQAVFDARERGHMADVRQLVLAFYALVLVAAALLVAFGAAARGAPWFWGAVAAGAKVLAVGAVAIGIAFALTFDAAFTLFHQLFFAEGTWTFDPATDRLVQLFPYQFWTETTIAIAVAGLGLTVATWAMARHLAGRGTPPGPGSASAAAR